MHFMVMVLTDETFAGAVESGVVIVDFWASWCGPCKQMAPVFEEASVQLEGIVKFAKVNVDECPNVAAKCGIRSIPTFIAFKDGKQVDVKVGGMAKHVLMSWAKSF